MTAGLDDMAVLRGRVAALFRGRRVLAIGSAAREWAEVIAPEAVEVTALDESEAALAPATPLPDFGRRHDGVFAAFWWSRVPQDRIDALLEGIVRAAAPGAMLAFLDAREPDAFPGESALIKRATRFGWGPHVELLPRHWLLTFWAAPR